MKFSKVSIAALSFIVPYSVKAAVFSYDFTASVTTIGSNLSSFASVGDSVTGTVLYDTDSLAEEFLSDNQALYFPTRGGEGIRISMTIDSQTWLVDSRIPGAQRVFGPTAFFLEEFPAQDRIFIGSENDPNGDNFPGWSPGDSDSAYLGIELFDTVAPFELIDGLSADQVPGTPSESSGFISLDSTGNEDNFLRFSITSLTPVPEPSAALLCLFSGIALTLRRQRNSSLNQ